MADKIVQKLMTQILLRNDSANNWATVNPILSKGEMGIELETGMFKIGDGTNNWKNLPYAHKTLIDENVFKYDASGKLVLNVPQEQAVGSTLKVQKDGTLAWEAPSNITVEGLNTSVEALNEAVFGTDDGTIAATGLTSRVAELEVQLNGDPQNEEDKGLVGALAAVTQTATTNQNAIATLNGDVETDGSVAKAVATAKSELEGKINAKADASALNNYVTTSDYNAHLTTQKATDDEQDRRLGVVEGAAADNKGDIEALGKVINGEDGTSGLVKDVADLKVAVGEGSSLDTRLDEVEGKVSTLEGTVSTLSGTGAGSVKEAKDAADAAQGAAIDAKAAAEDAQEDVDALKEEVYGKTDGVLNTTSRIDTLEEKVAGLEGFDHGTYATKEELTAVSNIVNVLNGEATTEGSVKAAKKVADDAYTQAGINAQAIATLNGSATEEGSIAKAIKDSQDVQDLVIAGKASQSDLNAVEGKVTAIEGVLNDTTTGSGESAVVVPGLISRVATVEDKANNNANEIAKIQGQITELASSGLTREIVAPAEGEENPKYGLEALNALTGKAENVIYIVKESADATDYAEYMYVKGSFEKIGATAATWEGYVTEGELSTALNNYHTVTAKDAFADKQAFVDHVAEFNSQLGTKPTVEQGQTAPTVWGELADLEANKLNAADEFVQSVSEDFTVDSKGQLSINRTKVFVLDGGNAAGWPSPEEE